MICRARAHNLDNKQFVVMTKCLMFFLFVCVSFQHLQPSQRIRRARPASHSRNSATVLISPGGFVEECHTTINFPFHNAFLSSHQRFDKCIKVYLALVFATVTLGSSTYWDCHVFGENCSISPFIICWSGEKRKPKTSGHGVSLHLRTIRFRISMLLRSASREDSLFTF